MAIRDPFCLTPIITAADTRVIATAQYSSYYSWRAFNGLFPTNGTSYIPSTKDFYIGWNFGVPTKVNYINIYYDHTGSSLPLTFVVEGSNNNTNWEIIKSFEVSGLAGCTLYSYSLDNVYTYKQYRYRVLTYTAGSYVYFGELEICFNPGTYTWDTLKKGTNVTITENNANNLTASYTQAAGSWIRGDSLVASQECFWALEVVEIAVDANVLVGAIPVGRELSDFVTNEPGMISIPAGTLSVGSIIFVKVNQNEKRVYVYVNSVLLGSCQYTSTGYLVPALGDLAATTQCKFTAHFGATTIPGVSAIFGSPADFKEYLVYYNGGKVNWIYDIPQVEFNYNVYLAQFDIVVWVDSVRGNDSNGGTKNAPVKAWNVAFPKMLDAPYKCCMVIMNDSVFYSNTTITINANKNITFLGYFTDYRYIPTFQKSSGAALFLNYSSTTKIVRMRVLNAGTVNTTIENSSTLAALVGTGAAMTFENCYIQPRGTRFIWMNYANQYVTFKNCIIDYGNTNFLAECVGAVPSAVATFINCVFLGSFTHRGTTNVMSTVNVLTSIYTGGTLLGHTLDEHSCLDYTLIFEPIYCTVHSTNSIWMNSSYWLGMGTGLNIDGTNAHVGVYGGYCAWHAFPLDFEGGFQVGTVAQLDLVNKGSNNVHIWNNDLSVNHSNQIGSYKSYVQSTMRITKSKPNVD